MTTTKADPGALALALHEYARAADDEATKARRARDTEIRRLHAEGVSMSLLADQLGVQRRYLYRVLNEEER